MSSHQRFLLLFALVLLYMANFILESFIHVTRASDYDANQVALMTELVRLGLCTVLEALSTITTPTRANGTFTWSSWHLCGAAQPMDSIRMAIPPLLYWLDGVFLGTGLYHLNWPTLPFDFQARLVVIAFVSVHMMNRQYSTQHWISFIALSAAEVLLIVDSSKRRQSPPSYNSPPHGTASIHVDATDVIHGVIFIAAACFVWAIAGVYTEKVLKETLPLSTLSSASNTIDISSTNAVQATTPLELAPTGGDENDAFER